MKEFHSINALSTNICFGNDLDVEDLISHHALWHKSCHLKYSGSRLTRTKKRKTDHIEESGRMPTKCQAFNIKNCMFCEMESEERDPLQVLTFDADANIRDMVTELQEQFLPRTIKEWNTLPPTTVASNSLTIFQSSI